MSTYAPTPQRGTAVRHSKEDAVDDETFEKLVATTYEFDPYYAIQCRFVLFVAGRLGLRSGEIAHMTEDWIDWRRSMISIPRHEKCNKGRSGGPCGICKQQAQQMARVRRENGDDPDATAKDFYGMAWNPKTDAAVRDVAFDSVTRADIAITEFFEDYDRWPHTATSINRRVNKMARHTDGVDEDDIYPHALRATAATYWAAHQIGPHALQSLMGWANLSTSRKYISNSGERTAAAMRDVVQ